MPDSDRAQWSFGRLLQWHFDLGTRGGKTGGAPWVAKNFADKIDKNVRTVRNWVKDKYPPQDIRLIERILFGDPRRADAQCEALRLELRTAFARKDPASSPAAAAPSLPSSNIPRVSTLFMGRNDALATIAAALHGDGRRFAVAITALHGLRGVGKSTLAAAYAELHRGDYKLNWWIRAHEDRSLRADLVDLGVRLNWVGRETDENPALAAVMERLRDEGDGLLLIYDNAISADAIERWLPRGGGAHVIVTSTDYAWRGLAVPVAIDGWPPDIGADFLIARSGRGASERGDAEALSRALGGLPLAHEVAGAWCYRPRKPLAGLLKLVEETPVQFINDEHYVRAGYGHSIAKTFTLAIDAAAERHRAAEPLILHAAMLAPDPIPLFLFAEARDMFDEPLRSALVGDGLDEAVAALREFALGGPDIVDQGTGEIVDDIIHLHRLVREVAVERAGARGQEIRQTLAAALAAVYPERAYNDPALWPTCAPLTPHALSICRTGMIGEAAANCAEILIRAGRYLHGRGAYAEARPLLERSLSIREQVRGPDHAETATSLTELAFLLGNQGYFAEARKCAERARGIFETLRGPDHLDTATSLITLALVLEAQAGDLAAARRVAKRACDIFEALRGPDHPDTARAYDTLALILHNQGDPEGARHLVECALAINETVHGLEHRDTLNYLNHLAGLMHALGDSATARSCFERVLTIREKVLGAEHPDTAVTLNELALVLTDQDNLEAAQAYYERALTIRQKVLGPAHFRTANSLHNLAHVLSLRGDTERAEALFRQAIAAGEAAIGREHPVTQRFCGRYARFQFRTGRPAEALPLAETALATHDACYGPNHRWTRESAGISAEVLEALDRRAEAAALRARYRITR